MKTDKTACSTRHWSWRNHKVYRHVLQLHWRQNH